MTKNVKLWGTFWPLFCGSCRYSLLDLSILAGSCRIAWGWWPTSKDMPWHVWWCWCVRPLGWPCYVLWDGKRPHDCCWISVALRKMGWKMGCAFCLCPGHLKVKELTGFKTGQAEVMGLWCFLWAFQPCLVFALDRSWQWWFAWLPSSAVSNILFPRYPSWHVDQSKTSPCFSLYKIEGVDPPYEPFLLYKILATSKWSMVE